jgi:hypothetical protein
MNKRDYPEEFKILFTTRRRLNEDIYIFREENPNYQIFSFSTSVKNISVFWRMEAYD